MSLQRLAIGAGVGFAAGLLFRSKLPTDNLPPERVLKMVKHNLASKVTINGSWIHMIPEILEKNSLEYTVYRGGVTASTNEGHTQFDFVVDATTGTILELNEN